MQIAQVLVNGAYWTFAVQTEAPIERLQRAVVSLDYPWVEGEPQRITLVTSTGLTFETVVGVAAVTPGAEGRTLRSLALLGVYIGVIPVFLGMLWLPFLRVVRSAWYSFFLALTVGLLLFLGIRAGAIFQVAVEIGRYMGRRSGGVLLAPGNAAGLLAGVLVMYATSLLVTA